MRLSPHQIGIILATSYEVMGADASVWLYGTRLDDMREGCDVDLLVEASPAHGLLCRARLKSQLEQRLQLPGDVLQARRGRQRIYFYCPGTRPALAGHISSKLRYL